jgi:hypothetical protein
VKKAHFTVMHGAGCQAESEAPAADARAIAVAITTRRVVNYYLQKAATVDKFANDLKQMGDPEGCTIFEVIQQGATNFKRQSGGQTHDRAISLRAGLEQGVDDANCYLLYRATPKVRHFPCCSFDGAILVSM